MFLSTVQYSGQDLFPCSYIANFESILDYLNDQSHVKKVILR